MTARGAHVSAKHWSRVYTCREEVTGCQGGIACTSCLQVGPVLYAPAAFENTNCTCELGVRGEATNSRRLPPPNSRRWFCVGVVDSRDDPCFRDDHGRCLSLLYVGLHLGLDMVQRGRGLDGRHDRRDADAWRERAGRE